MQTLFVIFGVFGLFFCLFLSPYKMCKGIEEIEADGIYDLGFKDKLLCAIPIFNIFKAEHSYSGGFLTGILTLLFPLGLTFRFFTIFNYPQDEKLQVISLYVMLFGLLATIISNMILVARVLMSSGVVEGFYLVVMIIAYPIGQYFIGTFLYKAIKNDRKRDSTYKWES